MIVSNGNFADPENPDSDGDGLLDGDEIIGTLRRDSYSINAPDEAVLFKYTFECVSDPNTEDSDGDGYTDDIDFSPQSPITDEERTILEFFNNAEDYEIRFVLENPWLKDLGTIKGIKSVEIFRRHKKDRDLAAIEKEMIAANLVEDPKKQKLIDRIMQFILGYTGNPSAMLFAEYELFENNMSMSQIMEASWAVWSNDMKMVAEIWLFGVSDLIMNGWAKWDYSYEYKLSLWQEQNLKSINNVIHDNTVVKFENADEVNDWWKSQANLDNSPYKPNTKVTTIKLNKDTKFVRVYTKNTTNMAGQWIMNSDDIVGLTPKQIKDKYALPYEPTHVCDVIIPANSQIRVGIANSIPEWGNGGGIQYDLINQYIGEFYNSRLL